MHQRILSVRPAADACIRSDLVSRRRIVHLLSVASLKNRALIALVTIVIAVFGVISMSGLKQELAPNITFPQLAIVTSYPGAAPGVVNDDVSGPIEKAVRGVPGLESTSATSSTNLSLVSATFTYGTDLGTAEQKINQAINRISSSLPDNVDPEVMTGSLDDLPVIQIAATGANASDLADLLDRVAVSKLEDVSGVREAALVGATGQRVTITPDAAKLAAAGKTTAAISDALQQNGSLVGAGEITEGDNTYAVQAGSKLHSVDDLKALPIVGAMEGDTQLTLGDVASISLTENPATTKSRVNGEDALSLSITKLPDANTVEVSTGVRDILPELEKSLGDDVTLTIVFDQAPYIQQSIESLTTEGLLGLLFAVLVILLFLLDVRATLVTAISIPTSVLITFIGLQTAEYTLNILTLGALTIAIGRVVDDSIVVIENIKRHLALAADRSGTGRLAAILTAVREVAGAITASTITTVAVFLPLAFVGDMTGELFRPFALTITIALLASLLVSLTIVPVLAYWFLRAPSEKAQAAREQKLQSREAAEAERDRKRRERDAARAARRTKGAPVAEAQAEPVEPAEAALPAGVAPMPAIVSPTYVRTAKPFVDAERAVESEAASDVESRHTTEEAPAPSRRARRAQANDHEDELKHPTLLQRGYLPIIRWTLKHSVTTIILALLVMGVTLSAAPFMKTNFLGSSGQNTLSVSQTLEPGTSLEAQDAAAQKVEDVLLGIDGIDTVQLSIGSSGSGLSDAFLGGGANSVSYSITTDEDADQDALQQDVRDELDAVTDAGTIEVSSSSGFGASSDIEVDITATNADDLQEATDKVTDALGDLDAIVQVSDNLAESRPYIAVTVDRTAAAEAGYSEVALSSFVSSATQPQQTGSIVIDDTTLTIYLQADDEPASLDELKDLEVPTPAGVKSLSSLADVEVTDGPASITTVNTDRSSTVSATPSSDNIGTASAEVQQAVDALDFPAGVSAELGGVTADQGTAFQQLGLAMLAAILIVYIVMVATFRSLRQPLLLLVSVPFAATGAIGLQLATGVPLGVPSLIGVLMLIGIVVTNAIVLVDLVNQYRDRGLTVADAVEHGSARRLRPILMTALATIFALTPMALGVTGHGGFISQPLAIVVIGGLVSSTVLTLVVLPTLYNLVEGARERRTAKRAARENR